MRLGSRLGPAAIRLAGIIPALEELGLEVTDSGDVDSPPEETVEDGMRHFPALYKCVESLKSKVGASLVSGNTPVVLGGEHTLVVGGISAALNLFDGDLAIIWIDAHADVNTPGSSSTGNIHGMPIAALLGLESETSGVPDEEWGRFLNLLGPARLAPNRTAWYGLRDVDPSERKRLHGLPLTMHDIDRYGVEKTVADIEAFLKGTGVSKVWISFDVDALDPILAPGTGTAVRGGLSYREAHLCAELLHEMFQTPACEFQLAGVDLVETNPLYDSNNETAKMAIEWIASLFGKTILGAR